MTVKATDKDSSKVTLSIFKTFAYFNPKWFVGQLFRPNEKELNADCLYKNVFI